VSFTFRCALIFVDTYAHTILLEVISIFHKSFEKSVREFYEAFTHVNLIISMLSFIYLCVIIHANFVHKFIVMIKSILKVMDYACLQS
jgi:hypothetical protein